tara:strand:+ start:9721 stop:9933 length:213 start_codon:yes stop_codon:yes gene_type:complete
MENKTEFSESFILGLIASLGGLIGLIFNNMRKSRCADIRCCWGMFSCNREVLSKDELQLEPVSPDKNNHL